MSFYYGWTEEQVYDLSLNSFYSHLKCIDIFLAEEATRNIQVSSYPHTDKKGQKDIWKKITLPFNQRDKRVKSYKEVVQNLARKLRGE